MRVALEPALYEALQGMDISPEDRARELIVLGLFREGRMTAGRAAWHLSLSEQEFTDLLAYKGISQDLARAWSSSLGAALRRVAAEIILVLPLSCELRRTGDHRA